MESAILGVILDPSVVIDSASVIAAHSRAWSVPQEQPCSQILSLEQQLAPA